MYNSKRKKIIAGLLTLLMVITMTVGNVSPIKSAKAVDETPAGEGFGSSIEDEIPIVGNTLIPNKTDELQINFFNYNRDNTKLLGNIDESDYLYFTNGDGYAADEQVQPGSPNHNYEDQRYIGLVQQELNSGLPVFNKSFSMQNNGNDNPFRVDASNPCYKGTGTLRLTADDGYFTYDSKKNSMYFDAVSKAVTLGDAFPTAANTIDPKWPLAPGFYPFGYNLNKPANFWTEDSRQFPENFHFGISFSREFYLPTEQESQEESIFTFSGDDDVFIFVDGQLVLDMGGRHGSIRGTVNFTTGQIEYQYEGTGRNTDKTVYTTQTGGTVSGSSLTAVALEPIISFEKGTYHTLDFFYLERGGWFSNCQFSYSSITINPDYTVKHMFQTEPESNHYKEMASNLVSIDSDDSKTINLNDVVLLTEDEINNAKTANELPYNYAYKEVLSEGSYRFDDDETENLYKSATIVTEDDTDIVYVLYNTVQYDYDVVHLFQTEANTNKYAELSFYTVQTSEPQTTRGIDLNDVESNYRKSTGAVRLATGEEYAEGKVLRSRELLQIGSNTAATISSDTEAGVVGSITPAKVYILYDLPAPVVETQYDYMIVHLIQTEVGSNKYDQLITVFPNDEIGPQTSNTIDFDEVNDYRYLPETISQKLYNDYEYEEGFVLRFPYEINLNDSVTKDFNSATRATVVGASSQATVYILYDIKAYSYRIHHLFQTEANTNKYAELSDFPEQSSGLQATSVIDLDAAEINYRKSQQAVKTATTVDYNDGTVLRSARLIQLGDSDPEELNSDTVATEIGNDYPAQVYILYDFPAPVVETQYDYKVVHLIQTEVGSNKYDQITVFPNEVIGPQSSDKINDNDVENRRYQPATIKSRLNTGYDYEEGFVLRFPYEINLNDSVTKDFNSATRATVVGASDQATVYILYDIKAYSYRIHHLFQTEANTNKYAELSDFPEQSSGLQATSVIDLAEVERNYRKSQQDVKNATAIDYNDGTVLRSARLIQLGNSVPEELNSDTVATEIGNDYPAQVYILYTRITRNETPSPTPIIVVTSTPTPTLSPTPTDIPSPSPSGSPSPTPPEEKADDDKTPLGPILPDTGTSSPILFYLFAGGLVITGIAIRRKTKQNKLFDL